MEHGTVLEKLSHKQTVGRNMSIKGASGEGSKGNEEHVFGNLKKGNPCYTTARSLAELCPVSYVKSSTCKQ